MAKATDTAHCCEEHRCVKKRRRRRRREWGPFDDAWDITRSLLGHTASAWGGGLERFGSEFLSFGDRYKKRRCRCDGHHDCGCCGGAHYDCCCGCYSDCDCHARCRCHGQQQHVPTEGSGTEASSEETEEAPAE